MCLHLLLLDGQEDRIIYDRPGDSTSVALADGSTTVDEQSISIERIISGMLKILAYDTEHPHPVLPEFRVGGSARCGGGLTIAAIAQQQKETSFAEELFLTVCRSVPNPLPISTWLRCMDTGRLGCDKAKPMTSTSRKR